MKILVLLLSPLLLFAKVHYAKVEPYESVVLKSAVSGLVMHSELGAEGSMVDSKLIIHIDDKLDVINLKDTKKSIELLGETLKINKNIAKTLKVAMQRQEGHYRRMSKLKTASKTQKDNAYSTYSSAKTQYLSTEEKIVNLRKQILETKYKEVQLEDTIAKKSIALKNKYLYKLIVRKGDFVTAGSPLAQVADASRAKLILFLEPDELTELEEKIVYLDGLKTEYKVDKVWKIADEKFISSYRAEIYISAPKGAFSKLVKVEIK